MRSPIGRRQPADVSGITRNTVGNATVLSTDDRMSEEARTLAFAVRPDDDNDVLVLDLQGEQPLGIWESVAAAVGRRGRRGIRLVVCGQHPEMARLAGQWLSDRLGRPVLAPYGELVRAKSGQLFVHAGQSSGWVRHLPGRVPRWEAKRFPRPVWDDASTEPLRTGAAGIAEPLPAGVWLRDSHDAADVADHWRWLVASMPCLPDRMSVLLGCPGRPPLSLDDIARFWRTLSGETRSRVRFVGYGPVQQPHGEALGQVLADLLGEPVACFAGLPLGDATALELYTVTPGGGLGWRTYAMELGYQPRAESQAAPPRLMSWWSPLVLGEPTEPRVYWYAPDAVVEVVQAGLWVRPIEVPPGAERIRTAMARPDFPAFIFDDSAGERSDRMRTLAGDVLARMDPATRGTAVVVAASAAVAWLTERPADDRTTGIDVAARWSAVVPLPGPAGRTAAEEPTAVVATEDPTTLLRMPAAQPIPDHPAPVEPPEPFAPAGLPSIAAPADLPAIAALSALAAPADVSALAPPAEPPAMTAAPEVSALAPPAEPPAMTAPAELPAMTAPAELPAMTTPPEPPAGTAPVAAPGPVDVGVRRQAAPVPAAAGVVRDKDLSDERAWLRRTLSREFDAVSSSVARVLSELPGLQTAEAGERDDIVVDAVALRLFLSPQGATIDAGLRAAAKGPHVPLARCAAAGLARMPSHRGPAVIPASPVAAQWDLLRDAKLFTEWGFLSALAEPSADLTGDTDVLVWSMTGRRTRALEPAEGADRVVFAPGTSFVVLEAEEPRDGARGRVLMRELSAQEIGADGRVGRDRAFLDEVAGGALRRRAEDWAGREPSGRVGAAAAGRVGALPGMLSDAEGKRS
ncbi:hypothetical protein GCM10010435_40970 [Winogradskya consettensis]|uniref:Uncharacterized protein n=2 Tax=Winogradskya consettensis TaxID=113560 RepID=A0A919SDE5_9ACTN|nr:hypothetical protein Aco04nite_17100 [Actinoplanes consettensis]